MKTRVVIFCLSALAHKTRLKAFRILVEMGEDGMPAGALSDKLGIPHNTLSFHLLHLADAELVKSRKKGRSIIYTANFKSVGQLVMYLTKHCCAADRCSYKDLKRVM